MGEVNETEIGAEAETSTAQGSTDQGPTLSSGAMLSLLYVDLLINQFQAMGGQLQLVGAGMCLPSFATHVRHLQKLREQVLGAQPRIQVVGPEGLPR